MHPNVGGWRWLRAAEASPVLGLTMTVLMLIRRSRSVGEIEVMSFESDGKSHEIAIWAQGAGGVSYDPERLKDDFKKIVDECIAIFGDTPYERYVFLIHIAPGAGGGTEHLNSTIMQASPAVFDSARSYRGFLGLTAHEFFHTWNVKQLRPEGLVPYDYQRENYTDLWVAEERPGTLRRS
ncbi:MAG: hypothetical protein KF705_00950 [Phycisphaeraceae bacterium]|nr:hypothetical protein [Phycisphaeraceae bacterium]